MHDGDRGDVHIASHDDGSGALIDDHARRPVGIDCHSFQFRDEFDRAGGEVGWKRDRDQRGIFRVSDGCTADGKLLIHGLGDARRSGEVGIVQLQPEMPAGIY